VRRRKSAGALSGEGLALFIAPILAIFHGYSAFGWMDGGKAGFIWGCVCVDE